MNQQAKNKNPLLSCALTGGFEDLSTGIVLTAAEKPVFTIGNAPLINDTDNFSEVSLDRDGNSSEIGQPSDLPTDLVNPYYTSPLSDLDSYSNLQTLHDLQQQPPPTLDINSNNQQQAVNDGNLNPISALGTAASSVFSTFSSIIKGSSSQTKFEDQNNQPQYVQEQPTPLVNETYQPDAYSFNQIQPQQPDPSAPPPSFFSPSDEMLFNKKPSVDVPSNTFRLGGNKKKTYAHIPGLSSSQQSSQNVPANFNLNPVMPPLPPQPVTHVDSMPNFQPPPPLQQPQQNFYETSAQQLGSQMEKSSNKFSFSSLLDKIPVSMNLFGSTEQNGNGTSYNNEYGHVTAAPTQPINYFSPQTQMTEPQIINNSIQQQQQQQPIMTTTQNYFDNLQNFMAQNFSVTTTDVQNTDVTQISSSMENVQATVNFFNPQQFNTSPFAKVQQPPVQQGNEVIETVQNSSVTSSPPMMAQNHQFVQSAPPPAMPQGMHFTDSSQTDSSAPPVFFNPTQASEMFKQRQNDDGRPKNPYSNNRARGVGLYKARSSSITDTLQPQMFVQPSAPSPSQMLTPVAAVQQQAIGNENVVENLRPPSIPPLVAEQNVVHTQNVNPIQTGFFDVKNTEVQAQISPFMVQPQPIQQERIQTPPQTQSQAIVQKKSDLNVPESENMSTITAPPAASSLPFEQEQKSCELQQQESHPQPAASNVSNFFSFNDNTKVNEQVSALNFFQVEPEAKPQQQAVVDCFEQRQQQDAHNNSFNVINFFSMDETPKICAENQPETQQCNEYGSNNINNIEDDDDKKEDIQADFNSPITSSTMMQANDLVMNDITDKMESLSACSRSTLSLFATSELDSTMGQQKLLSSAPVESLIPKYLEQQPQIGSDMNDMKSERSLVNGSGHSQPQKYRPIYCHWFYQNLYWHPFSMTDSMAIEQAIVNGEETVCTSGGRYEVNIKERRRSSIYWSSGSNVIRKCSWFFMDEKNGSQNLIPYDENVAELLEKEYEKTMNCDGWNHKVVLSGSNDFVVMKDPGNMVHHKMEQILVVKRGVDEFDIDDGEEGTADHLILCVNGFGDKIDDSADEVRTKCLETIQQYYTEAFDCGQIRRIEVLPIILNSIDVLKMYEINNTLQLKSPPSEINEHIMRTMLYSNENFYQKIMNHLAFSLNEIVSKFKQRNGDFGGEISIISSSYEALFVFDILARDNESSEFWKLNFNVSKFFACGIPTSALMIRNGDTLRHGFELKKCKKLYNIIHPADKIAQRIEPLVIPEYAKLQPESIENSAFVERIDFLLPENSALEKFVSSKYFSTEVLIRRITNEIYGANHIEMDSGSL